MSSSNQVRVAFIEESTYGEVPAAGNFETARFTSDSLSGTPETTESQQIRTDRMSSGQVVTGLTVGGDLNFELAKEDSVDLLFKSAMYQSAYTTDTPVTVDVDIEATTKKLTRDSGDWNSDTLVGDMITLTGFSNAENNTQVMVAAIDSTTVLSIIGKSDLVTEEGSGTTYAIADKLDIGTTKTSFSMEKAFLDLTTKAINYNGMIVSGFNISAAYGSIITGAFNFMGNGYETANVANEFITDSRTITAAATTQSLNGSVDMDFIASSATGSFIPDTFCIQSVEITVNNNLNVQNCIGRTAPFDYTEGTCQIEVSISAYLADGNWALLEQKLEQTPFQLGFLLKNSDGFYGFYLPAVQVSFDDPVSAGQNQDIIMSMSGTAKVGASGESALTVFKG